MANWIIASNPNQYDSDKAFRKNGMIDWRQTSHYDVGDLVYIYGTRPEQRIKYETRVIDTDLTFENRIDDSDCWVDYNSMRHIFLKNKFVRLKLIREFNCDGLSLEDLNNNGLKGRIQGPRRLLPETYQYIISVVDNKDDLIERRTEFWSKAIKDFRRKHNLTQEEFAYGSGLTRTSIVLIENEYSKRIQKITAEALVKYMNIDMPKLKNHMLEH